MKTSGGASDGIGRGNARAPRPEPEPAPYGSDFLQLDAADAPVGGKSDWLTERLRQAIADGRLPVGSRLPPTRVLAAELRVSRGVVTEAYQRLTEDGHVEGRRRAGTVVVAAPLTASLAASLTASPAACPVPAPAGSPAARPAEPARSAAAPGAHPVTPPLFPATPAPDVFDALRAAPARIDLTPGLPDLAAFPRTAWLQAERAVLSDLSAADLGYGDPRGAPRLRSAVADWLARSRGIRVTPDEVLVVAGTAQALTLLHPVLRADGVESVAVEDPGSLGTRQHLVNGGLATPPVPVDQDGVRVDALHATGARAVLLTPAHQFPTGVVTSGERRRELLRWAAGAGDGGRAGSQSGGRLIIEDDYDAEHRYDRPPVPALRALLADRVCYLGSISKLLAPALRIGWMVPPPHYRDALAGAKRFTDLGNAVLPQLVLARLMASGELERHLRMLRGRHRRRRDAMAAAIAEHLPGAVTHGAAAGLHLTVTYPALDVPDTELAAAALARGVKCQPLSWHRQVPGRPGLVLGYAATPPGAVAEGVAALGEALRALS
ncbi:MocR-like pyridoxine biosynthesis transcription factor PdxR [Actinacidiphila acidipaludis]|uniref:PLP-dependent aminotransferase family protein n=1 Tax=Actinacidiphila acidipaludis TaxID=2873382 RepID=A0ABS7QAD2_9ACTN|nr:PLP-dependent aminotransferase family protein [Streptomyces acidipaludis]MBY8879796.1 PLP-dependent aminotransferase family protein [Streptomyces acidipaludis]